MNDDTLRRLTQEHRLDRMREAQCERQALQLRDTRVRRTAKGSYAPLLGHLLAFRRHATH